MPSPSGDRPARCLRGCKDSWAFPPAPQLSPPGRLRKTGAIPGRKIQECSVLDRPHEAGDAYENGRQGRSLNFHHHQRTIVRDGSSLHEFLHFLKNAVGQFGRCQMRVGGQ